MDTRRNLALDIIRQAQTTPEAIAVVTPTQEIPYGVLRHLLLSFSIRMARHGVGRQACVGLKTADPLVALCSVLAVALRGARWVEVTQAAMNRRKELGMTHLFHSGDSGIASDNARVIRIGPEWQQLPEDVDTSTALPIPPAQESGDAVWMYAQSSGTTGRTKFIPLSYETYWQRYWKTGHTHDFSPAIAACLFPPLSGPWVSYVLRIFASRGTYVSSKSFERWLEAGVVKVFGSPAQFTGYFDTVDYKGEGRLPIAHVAGANMGAALAHRLGERFDEIQNFYGATEVAGVSRRIYAPDEPVGAELGQPLSGNEIRILRDDGSEAAPGEEGRIAIRNDCMVQGYLNDAAATEAHFSDGWFLPGDHGALSSDGMLSVSGRDSDLINLGGTKFNAVTVDDVLQGVDGVADAICFETNPGEADSRISALVVRRDGAEQGALVAGLAAAVQSLPEDRRPAAVHFVPAVPRNANGKVVRGAASGLAERAAPVTLGN